MWEECACASAAQRDKDKYFFGVLFCEESNELDACHAVVIIKDVASFHRNEIKVKGFISFFFLWEKVFILFFCLLVNEDRIIPRSAAI